MKKHYYYLIILPVVITILIIILSVCTQRYLYATSNEMAMQLEKIESTIKSKGLPAASGDFDKLNDMWGKHKTLWTILLNHREIDTIDNSMRKLSVYINDDTSNFNRLLADAELASLKQLYTHLPEGEMLTLSNLF